MDSITCTRCQDRISWEDLLCVRCYAVAPTRAPRPLCDEELALLPEPLERPRAWLRLGGSRAAIEIDRPLVVGRSPSCDIRLGSPSLSRRHAVFLGEGRVYRVVDLGSRGGVYVNEAIVSDEVLEEGDVVKVDAFEFHVTFSEPGDCRTPLP